MIKSQQSFAFIALLSLLPILVFAQFSSFIPEYSLKVPSEFISPVSPSENLDDYVSFRTVQSTPQSTFGIPEKGPNIRSEAVQAVRKIKPSVCTFPFVLLDEKCQCPRYLPYSFGKCLGAVPKDYQQDQQPIQIDQNNNQDNSDEPDVKNKNKTKTQVICPIGKMNNNKKKGTIQDLSFILRTIDGTENNQNFRSWGSAGSFLERRLPARYDDGISQPLSNLPSPRQISNAVGSQANPIKKNRLGVTIAFTIFGQFIDHDIDLTPSQSGPDAEQMDIIIPNNDPFFQDQTTIPFRRSQFFGLPGKTRKHKNVITSWIDGSQIYGSDVDTLCALRQFRGGKMKTSGTKNNQFLPKFNNFFRAGDVRAIENSILATYHTIFVREHNRICDEVLSVNPQFNDETIFRIARNYVIGLLQKIYIKDFLPLLLGEQYQNLIPKYSGYKNNINPNIPTQFSTASFRLGHSLLINTIPTINKSDKIIKQFRLNELFFNQDIIDSDFMANIMRGCSKTLTKEKSAQIVDDVRNLLVLDPKSKKVKLDLYSLNLQRSRDHGLPSYNEARDAFSLPPIKSFAQLVPSNEIQIAKRLESVYENVDNIQLFVGIISEKPVKNGILGQLGVQIVGQTFRNLRDGDRFWYQGAYPRDVVDEIDNTGLGDIIARNTKATQLPSNIFV